MNIAITELWKAVMLSLCLIQPGRCMW